MKTEDIWWLSSLLWWLVAMWLLLHEHNWNYAAMAQLCSWICSSKARICEIREVLKKHKLT